MTHVIDGFQLEFTARRTWRAHCWAGEDRQHSEEIPVAWEHNRRGADLEVWHPYNRRREMDAHLSSGAPFTVALAKAKDPEAERIETREFVAVFEVVATQRLSARSIKVKIVQQLPGRE